MTWLIPLNLFNTRFYSNGSAQKFPTLLEIVSRNRTSSLPPPLKPTAVLVLLPIIGLMLVSKKLYLRILSQ